MGKITVQLFGAFRPLGEEMVLDLPDGASIGDLRITFQEKLPSDLHELLEVSRFADERVVLAETATFSSDARLAILPPVSGG